MPADEEKFINSINNLDIQGIRELCLSLYRENRQLRLNQAANEKINTEAFLLYQQAKSEKEAAVRELDELKKILEKEINKNSLNTKSTFGRKTEKLLSLIEAAEKKADEPEDEAQLEESDSNENHTNVHFHDYFDKKEQRNTKDSGISRKKNKGKSGKPNRLKESMKKLPKQIKYDIDTASLDEKYGEGNWRIAFWHSHETLEKIDTPYYVNVVYTPGISVGLEHNLYSEPYENDLVDRSVASASIVSDILYRKFVLSIPFNRQAVDYQMQGIELIKQTIINWISKTVPQYINPVVEYLTECLVKYKYTQNDETYIQVNRDDRGPGHKSYIWVHASSEYLDCNPIIIFCYEKTRNTSHLRSFYKEFMGYITCDAYISYQVLEEESGENIKISGCMMHCRRYFAEAFFINDISGLSDEQLKELPETKALMLIRDIYIEEKKLKDMSADDRLTIRKETVSPLVDRFFTYVHELSESKEIFSDRMNKAITYAINQEQRLRVFLTDGNICCDNGHAERLIRSYSVGRANWLFADTVFGAEINAMMYSVVETAKANKANVLVYLRYLLEKMPKHKYDSDRTYLSEMVPWADEYRQYESKHLNDNRQLCQNLFKEPDKPTTPLKRHNIHSNISKTA